VGEERRVVFGRAAESDIAQVIAEREEKKPRGEGSVRVERESTRGYEGSFRAHRS